MNIQHVCIVKIFNGFIIKYKYLNFVYLQIL